jgi:hypothetical protein
VLRGTVRASGGRPVAEARVTLLDAGGAAVDTLTTGDDGTFRFVDPASGEYTVIAAGYPPVATVLQVAGGDRTERDLHLGHEDRSRTESAGGRAPHHPPAAARRERCIPGLEIDTGSVIYSDGHY